MTDEAGIALNRIIDIREAEIKVLRAENAALKAKVAGLDAEVARLTPKPMEPNEIVVTLNKHNVRGAPLWEHRNSHYGPSFLFMGQTWDEVVCYSLSEATYIAQGLLRDAGPIVVQEPATQIDGRLVVVPCGNICAIKGAQ